MRQVPYATALFIYEKYILVAYIGTYKALVKFTRKQIGIE